VTDKNVELSPGGEGTCEVRAPAHSLAKAILEVRSNFFGSDIQFHCWGAEKFWENATRGQIVITSNHLSEYNQSVMELAINLKHLLKSCKGNVHCVVFILSIS